MDKSNNELCSVLDNITDKQIKDFIENNAPKSRPGYFNFVDVDQPLVDNFRQEVIAKVADKFCGRDK